MSAFETMRLYLSYDFVKYALAAGVLISLCAGLLGVPLVLRRLSMIGDGLSHVAFGALAVAAVMNVTGTMAVALPVTAAAAVILMASGRRGKKGDASLAMLSVGALAVGYLLLNLFSASSNVSGDVCGALFGSSSILNLTGRDVWLSAGLCLVVAAIFVLYFNRVFAISFDPDFARATGVRDRVMAVAEAVITAVVVVLAMRLAGALLISALVVFPAAAAMRLCRSFKGVVVCAGGISVVCAAAGMCASILLATPVGATIVAADILAFAIACAAGALRGR